MNHIEFAHLVHKHTPKTESPAKWMEERKHIVLHEQVHYHDNGDVMGYETHHLHVDEFVKRFPKSLHPDTFTHEDIHERMLLEAQENGDELMIHALTRWMEHGIHLTKIAKEYVEKGENQK